MIGLQTNLDIAQRLAPGQLREGHYAKQIGAVQGAHTRIASVALDDASKGLPWHVLHDLRKQRLANVFMRHSRSLKPESIANVQSKIQIVDTPESLKTPRRYWLFSLSDSIKPDTTDLMCLT